MSKEACDGSRVQFSPLLALKRKKNLSKMAGWVGPTNKGKGVFGHGKLRILFDLVPGTLNKTRSIM